MDAQLIKAAGAGLGTGKQKMSKEDLRVYLNMMILLLILYLFYLRVFCVWFMLLDEKMIIDILCNRTKSQMDAIDNCLRKRHNVTLQDYITSELSGNLSKFLSYSQMTNAEFDALMIHEAFSGFGSDKRMVIMIVCSRDYERLKAAK
jgi:hypothetical protein